MSKQRNKSIGGNRIMPASKEARGFQLPAINKVISPKKVQTNAGPKMRYAQRNMPVISQASMDTETWKELQKLVRPIALGNTHGGGVMATANEEMKYCKNFHRALKENDLIKQAIALQHLGDLHKQRFKDIMASDDVFSGDGTDEVLRSVGAYAGALSRAVHQEQKHAILSRVRDLECIFIEKYKPGYIDAETNLPALNSVEKYVKKIEKFREFVKKRINRIQDMWKHKFVEQERIQTKGNDIEILKESLNLGNKVKQEVKTWFKDIVCDCLTELGDPPCKYAIVGVGNIASNFFTPYCDFEYIILTKSPDLDSKEYFKCLAVLINIHIMMLGETPLTATLLKLVQDPYNKMVKTIMDECSPNGIKIDTGLASKSLNPFLFKYTKHILECDQDVDLIKTPADMVRFLYMLHDIGLQKFTIKMQQNMLIVGDNDLYNEYRDMVEDYFVPKSFSQEGRIQTDNQNMLQYLLDTLDVDYYVDLHRNNLNIGLPKILKDFELIPSLLYQIKVMFCITNKIPALIIEELKQKGHITENGEADLKTLICVSYYLKVRCFSQQGGQNVCKGLMKSNPEEPEPIDIVNSMFASKDTSIFVRMYNVLFELLQKLKGFYSCTIEEQKYSLKTFVHNKESILKYHALSKLGKYQEAIEIAKEYLQTKQLDFSTKEKFTIFTDLGWIALKINEAKDANMFFTKAMDIKDEFQNEEEKTFAFVITWHNMGLVHLFEGKFSKALGYFDETISMATEMGGSKVFKSKKGLKLLCMVYTSMSRVKLYTWDLQGSVKCLQLAMNNLQKMELAKPQILNWYRNVSFDLAEVKINLGSPKESLHLIRSVIEHDTVLSDIHCPQIQFASVLCIMTRIMKTMGKAVLTDLYAMYSQKMILTIAGKNSFERDIEIFEELECHEVIKMFRTYRDALGFTDMKSSLKVSNLICELHCEERVFRKTSDLDLALDKLEHCHILLSLEQYSEAKDVCLSTMIVLEKVYGHTSNILKAYALQHYGLSLLHTGDAEEALKQFQSSYATFNSCLFKMKIPAQLKCLEYIAEAYRILRVYDEAVKSWEECITLRKQLFGPIHLIVAYSLRKQGLLLQEMMEYESAVNSLQNSLDMYKRIFGHNKNNEDIALLHFDIGKIYCELFEEEKADHSLNKSLEIRRVLRTSQTQTKDLIETLTYLGNFYRFNSRTSEAIPLHQEAVDVAKVFYEKSCTQLAKVHAYLAEDYQTEENYERSSEIFEKAIAVHREGVGLAKDNLDVANWLRELGRAYEIMGIRDKASQCNKRSLQIKEQFMGKEAADADMLDSLCRMAERHENKGDFKRAIPLRKQYILKQKRNEGKEKFIIMALKALSFNYLQTGEHEYAQAYNTQLLEMLHEIHHLNPGHEEIAEAVFNAGFIFETMGRVPKAIKLYKNALAMYQELNKNGDYNEMLGIVMTNLGNSMNTAGMQEAVSVLHNAVDLLDSLGLLGGKKKLLAKAIFCLGTAYEVYPLYDKAVEYHKMALEIRQDMYTEADELTIAESLRSLGRSYCQLFQYKEGISLLTQSITISKAMHLKDKSKGYISDAHILIELGQALTKSGSPEEGISKYHEAIDIMQIVYGTEKPHLQIANCMCLLAEAWKETSHRKEAITYAEECMSCYKTVLKHVNDHPIYPHLTGLIADVYMLENDYENAVKYYRKAAQMYLSLHQGNVLVSDVEKNMQKLREANKLLLMSRVNSGNESD